MTVSGDSSPEGTNARIVRVRNSFDGAISFQINQPAMSRRYREGGPIGLGWLCAVHHAEEGACAGRQIEIARRTPPATIGRAPAAGSTTRSAANMQLTQALLHRL